MPKKHYLTLAAAALLGLAGISSAFAGTETATGKETKNPVAPCPVTYITGDFGVTFTSEYISRGIPQLEQTKGVIAQPYLDLYFKLWSGNGFINSVSAQLSFWSDIGSNYKTASPTASAQDWYEFDWDPGISVTFDQKFTLLVQYMEFDYPSSAQLNARSINATLTYDDSSLLGAFSMHPHVAVLYELPGETGHGTSAQLGITNLNGQTEGGAGLSPRGWYYELGVAPSYTFLPKSSYPITIALPTTVGLGDGRFYSTSYVNAKGQTVHTRNNFGYVSAGPSISVPLAFIPSGFGSWTLTAAYTYYYEGDTIRTATGPVGVGPNTINASGACSRNVYSGAIGCTF